MVDAPQLLLPSPKLLFLLKLPRNSFRASSRAACWWRQERRLFSSSGGSCSLASFQLGREITEVDLA